MKELSTLEETGIFKYFDDTKAGSVIATRDFLKAWFLLLFL